MFFRTPDYVRKQLFACFFLYVGSFVVGMGIGWPSPMLVKLQNVDESPLSYAITDVQASWVASIGYIGSITGPLISGKLSDIIGRIYCLILGALVSAVGIIMMTFPPNIAVLYAGRIISSTSTIILVVNLVLISEIASPNIRGTLLTLTGVFQALGCLLIYAVGPFISYHAVQYLLLAFYVLYIIGVFFVPESPVYYVLKDKKENAKKIFEKLGRTKDVDKEVEAIAESVKQSKEQTLQIGEIFTIRSNRKGLIICLLLFLLQHCGGVNSITMYSLIIFQNAGTPVSPEVANIIFGGAQFVGTLIAPLVVDKSGRKILLLVSTAGCALCMALMGVYFYLDVIEHDVVESLGWLSLISMLGVLLSYNSGLSIIPNSLVGEVFRSNVRSVGSSICLSLGFIGGFAMTLSFGYITAAIGMFVPFFIFAGVNVIGIIFIALIVPETKGLSLLEVQNMLSK